MTFLAWYIAVAYGLAAFAMAWYPCCCGGEENGDPCTYCSPNTPIAISVTISGLANNGCTCTELNTTHIVPQYPRSPLSHCFFWKHDSMTCGADGQYDIEAEAGSPVAGGWEVWIRVADGPGPAVDTYYALYIFQTVINEEGNPFNCHAEGVATLDSQTVIKTNPCDWSAVTVTVN